MQNYFFIGVLLAPFLISFLAVSLLFMSDRAQEVKVNLRIIRKIESSNNTLAYNSGSGACGAYQITPICLADYNKYKPSDLPPFTIWDMFTEKKARTVANWYLNERIPYIFRVNKIPDTLINRLIAYNYGWTGVKLTQDKLPSETIVYIRKYLRCCL